MTSDSPRTSSAASPKWAIGVSAALVATTGAFAYSQLLRADNTAQALVTSNSQVIELRGTVVDLQSRVTRLEHTASQIQQQIATGGLAASPGQGAGGQESSGVGRLRTVTLVLGDGDNNAASHVLVTRGNEKMKARDYAGAEADYREAMQVDPDSANVIAAVGVAQVFQNHIAEAVSTFEKSLQLRPNALALVQLGSVRYDQKRFAEAYRLTKAALEKKPTDQLGLWQMALIYEALEQHESALRMFAKYAALYPNTKEAAYAHDLLKAADDRGALKHTSADQ